MAIKALIFDVFGTLVDWRSSIAQASEKHLSPLGLQTNWLEFADAWRQEYDPAMEKVRSGQRGFCKLDELHRDNLDLILKRWGWDQVNEVTRQELNKAWHQLEAWADVGEAMTLLRQQFLLAPCSNGHIALMVNLARHNQWHWDAILGAEIAQDYKPQARVYQAAASALGLAFNETMMVAAHSSDLEAAAKAGLQTAFIARPDEYGPGLGESKPTTRVDVEAENLLALAQLLAKTN